MLEFLEDTRVGRMPGRVLLAGWPDVDEEMEEVELWAPEKVELWAPEEAEGPDISESSEEEDRPGLCFSFVFPLFQVARWCFFPFLLFRQYQGRRTGMPYFDCASWSGAGKVI